MHAVLARAHIHFSLSLSLSLYIYIYIGESLSAIWIEGSLSRLWRVIIKEWHLSHSIKTQIQEITPVNSNISHFSIFLLKKIINYISPPSPKRLVLSLSLSLSPSMQIGSPSLCFVPDPFSLYSIVFNPNQCYLHWSPRFVSCLRQSHPSTTLYHSTHRIPHSAIPIPHPHYRCWETPLETLLFVAIPVWWRWLFCGYISDEDKDDSFQMKYITLPIFYYSLNTISFPVFYHSSSSTKS